MVNEGNLPSRSRSCSLTLSSHLQQHNGIMKCRVCWIYHEGTQAKTVNRWHVKGSTIGIQIRQKLCSCSGTAAARFLTWTPKTLRVCDRFWFWDSPPRLVSGAGDMGEKLAPLAAFVPWARYCVWYGCITPWPGLRAAPSWAAEAEGTALRCV